MKDIITSLRRTPYQTFAAFSVLFFTLLLSGLLLISLTFLQGLLSYVETRPRIIVYFQIKASEADITSLRDKLLETEKTANIKFISKKDAYNIYKQFTKNDPILLEMTSPDILPASLEIDAKKPENLQEIANFVKKQPGVDEVQYQQDIVKNLLSLTSTVRRGTAIFFSYLLFMSIIVLTTTTSFKIALKKDEILLLRLLGASNWYIQRPFVMETIFMGVVAATLANIFLILTIFSASTFLGSYFSGIPSLDIHLGLIKIQVWPFNPIYVLLVFAITIFFSLMITLAGSLSATNRYLK